jgi:hypothetical protein
LEIRRFLDAERFLDRALGWLLENEAENNVLLGVLRQLIHGEHPYEEPIYLATIEVDNAVAGCAFRTPPFNLVLTRLPLSAVPALVQDVHQIYTNLPAVVGPTDEVTMFGDLWTQQCGGHVQIGMRQGIYTLNTVTCSASDVSGALRSASKSDESLVLQWADGFVADTGLADSDPRGRTLRLIRDGLLFLWEDGKPRSMAAAVAETPSGVRVGLVYTPPRYRQRGYATAAVAALSQSLLDGGRDFCCLFADLANPTSNGVYERIGYQMKCEVVDINFV